MNNLSIKSPEIQATIKWLRDKSGCEAEKMEAKYKAEIASLRADINRLENVIEKRDIVYRREFNRVIAFLRMLTTIRDRDLKRAIALIVYWDKFSWITCDIVDKMCLADKRVKSFFDLPKHFGNIKCIEKFVGTQRFANALKLFGYENAEERIRVIKK